MSLDKKQFVQLSTLREMRKGYQDLIDQNEAQKNDLQNQIWKDEAAIDLYNRLTKLENLDYGRIIELSENRASLSKGLFILKNDLDNISSKSFAQEKAIIREIDATISNIQSYEED